MDEKDFLDYCSDLTDDSEFKARNVAYKQDRLLVFQNRPVEIGTKTSVQFRSPEIEDDANAFKNRFLAAPAKIHVAAHSDKERAVTGAQKQENFYYRHYYRWRDAQVFDGTLFDMATLGVGWTHLRINEKALPELPDYKGDTDAYMEKMQATIEKFLKDGANDLFILEGIDPETMYWTPDKSKILYAADVPLPPLARAYADKGKRLYMEGTEMRVASLTPGEAIDSFSSRDTARVYKLEDDEYCWHAVSGKTGKPQLVGKYPNFLGRPAFFPSIGEKTGSSHPLYQYRALVNGKYQTVPLKNIIVTGLVHAGNEASQMRMQLVWEGEGTEPEGNPEVQVTPEGVVVPPTGYALKGMDIKVGVDLPQALGVIQSEDKYGFPKSIGRPEEVEATSGYDRAKQQDAVQSLLAPPLGHFGSMLADVFRAMASGVRAIDQPIEIRNIHSRSGAPTVGETIRIEPGDVVEADITVSFSSVSLFSSIALQEEGMKSLQADTMTMTEYLSDIRGIDDVEAWRDQLAMDKVRRAADDRAIQDVLLTIDALRGAVADEAIAANAVMPVVTTNEDQLRADRGPSVPTGPGAAMPVTPTPPGQAGLPGGV